MKTHFHVENEEFSHYFKLTVDGKEYYFSDHLTVEYDNRDSLTFGLEFFHAQAYFKQKAKNPLLRLVINLFKWVIFAIFYFVDNQNGIGLHKGYHGFEPFRWEGTFSLDSPDGKTVSIRYIKPVYNKSSMTYTPPAIDCTGGSVVADTQKNIFSPDALKQEWNTYHIPAFSLVTAILLALLALVVYACVKVFGHFETQEPWAVAGISVCVLTVIALLAWFIRMMAKADSLKNQIIQNNKAE